LQIFNHITFQDLPIMQNAWHAISVSTDNNDRGHYGFFDTREEALEAAFNECCEGEVCFALQADPDDPSDEYAGLPAGLTPAMLTLAQVREVQQFCRGCISDVSAYAIEPHSSGDPVTLRRASWDSDAGLWYRRTVRILSDGETHEPPQTAQTATPAYGVLLS
jgi:hypothetical protein